MLSAASLRARLSLGGLAAGGVVVTHWLAYRLSAPDEATRAELLRSTGHRLWPVISAIAMGALVTGLIGFAGEWLWGPSSRAARRSRLGLYRYAATGLIGLQAVGWVMLEGAERLFLRTHPEEVLHGHAVLIGLLIQVLVALIAAGLLVVFAEVVDRIARLVRASHAAVSSAATRLVGSQVAALKPLLGVGGAIPRGPPSG